MCLLVPPPRHSWYYTCAPAHLAHRWVAKASSRGGALVPRPALLASVSTSHSIYRLFLFFFFSSLLFSSLLFSSLLFSLIIFSLDVWVGRWGRTGQDSFEACPGTSSIDQAGLKLTEIRLPLPPKFCHHLANLLFLLVLHTWHRKLKAKKLWKGKLIILGHCGPSWQGRSE